jgi:ferric-dicitrate binding protein FerR (iron transport regulator)
MKELLIKLSDGTLTPEDARTLNDLLRGNPEACELYLNHLTLEAQMEREVAAVPMIRPIKPIRRIAWLKPLLAAAAAIALVFVLWPAKEQPSIATVLLAEDCQWQGAAVSEGSMLQPGTLHLQSGTAILRFIGGAEVVMRGSTRLELLTAGQARIIEGDVVVRAPEAAAGFQMLTPASDLTDLGTEFAVKVQPSGITELHVMEGEVAFGENQSTVVNAGQALRFEKRDVAPQAITLDSPRFTDLVRKANPKQRPELMTVYEGFHYDEGSYEPSDIVKGKGWAGPWRLRSGDEQRNPGGLDTHTDMRIVHDLLNVVWPVEGGRGGMLEMPAGHFFRLREMRRPLRMARDEITYFSFMTHEPQHLSPRSRIKPQEGFRLTFRSSADYWGECLSFGIQANLHPHIQSGPGVSFTSASQIPQAQTLLWVGKIISRAVGEDEINFSIYGEDDALDYAEPTSWQLASHGIRQSASFNLVVLSSTGHSPRILDELRLGPTWRSVVPIQLQLASHP